MGGHILEGEEHFVRQCVPPCRIHNSWTNTVINILPLSICVTECRIRITGSISTYLYGVQPKQGQHGSVAQWQPQRAELGILGVSLPSPLKPFGSYWCHWPPFKLSWHVLLLSNSMKSTFVLSHGNAACLERDIQQYGSIKRESGKRTSHFCRLGSWTISR